MKKIRTSLCVLMKFHFFRHITCVVLPVSPNEELLSFLEHLQKDVRSTRISTWTTNSFETLGLWVLSHDDHGSLSCVKQLVRLLIKALEGPGVGNCLSPSISCWKVYGGNRLSCLFSSPSTSSSGLQSSRWSSRILRPRDRPGLIWPSLAWVVGRVTG